MSEMGQTPEHEEIRTPALREYVKNLEAERDEMRTRAEQSDTELANLRREQAFYRAGIEDLTDPKFRYFVKGYDGEENPEAIRSALVEAQLIPNQADQNAPPAERDAFNRIAQVAAGASTTPPQTDWLARINTAKNKRELDEVMAQAKAAGVNIR